VWGGGGLGCFWYKRERRGGAGVVLVEGTSGAVGGGGGGGGWLSELEVRTCSAAPTLPIGYRGSVIDCQVGNRFSNQLPPSVEPFNSSCIIRGNVRIT